MRCGRDSGAHERVWGKDKKDAGQDSYLESQSGRGFQSNAQTSLGTNEEGRRGNEEGKYKQACQRGILKCKKQITEGRHCNGRFVALILLEHPCKSTRQHSVENQAAGVNGQFQRKSHLGCT